MKVVNQTEFKQKVDVILSALLSHDITREHASKCLSSVVVYSNDSVTQKAIEDVEKDFVRYRYDREGIDLRALEDIGVHVYNNPELGTKPKAFDELEFRLALGTESLPFMTEDVKDKWEKMAGLDVFDKLELNQGEPKAYTTWRMGARDPVLDVDVSTEPIHLGVATVEAGPPPPSTR